MNDSSSPSDSVIQIEIAKQNILEPKILIDFHNLKLVRIFALGLHMVLILLLIFVQEAHSLGHKLKDFSFWMLALSTVYFIGVVLRNFDKRPTTYLAGFFHAIWVLSGFNIITTMFFYIPLTENDNLGYKTLLLTVQSVYFGCQSIDFALNKLLLQMTASIAFIVTITSSYGLFMLYLNYMKNGRMPTFNDVKNLTYKSIFLYFFIIVTSWLTYVIIHRYKYVIVKKKAAQASLRVGVIKSHIISKN